MASGDRSVDDRAYHRVATDLIIRNGDRVVLVQRKYEPFKGDWVLPGGHVERGEQVADAAEREAREETGLEVELQDVLGVYDAPGRDPRGHVISVVYRATTAGEHLTPSTDAADAAWFGLDNLPDELGFDHRSILDDFLQKRG